MSLAAVAVLGREPEDKEEDQLAHGSEMALAIIEAIAIPVIPSLAPSPFLDLPPLAGSNVAIEGVQLDSAATIYCKEKKGKGSVKEEETIEKIHTF